MASLVKELPRWWLVWMMLMCLQMLQMLQLFSNSKLCKEPEYS